MAAELCHTKIMRKKNSLTKPQPIGEILSAALKRNGMALPMQEQAVIKLWPKAVGAQIAAQTQPDRLRAGTLFVRTSSSVWVQQLHFMKEEIRQKINELAGKTAVRDIHFTIGYQPSQNQRRNGILLPKKIILKDSDRQMIKKSTDAIADRELAEILERVMEKEISLRRLRQGKPTR